MTAALGTGGYTVSPSELQDHANVVSQLSDQLGHTLGSAQQATLGSQAFGEISVALGFASIIKAVATPGISSLAQAQSMLTTINRTISTTAANYGSVEQSNMSRFLPSTGATSSTTPTNPLLNPKPSTGAGNNGASILTDVSGLEKDISSGSWIQAGLAGMKVVQDVGAILSNPIGAVVSFGFNFLMNAVKPLQQAIGWLIGNPGQVASYGGSWQGVAQQVVRIGNTFSSSVSKSTANWTGAAADSYRTYASDRT
ncbi:MAG TPA: hypothetical protein VH333_17945, partial [Pseudonocardiaceae bacterium]|nr:hypothetical protein [Pseudonocardiaceae bacterium]